MKCHEDSFSSCLVISYRPTSRHSEASMLIYIFKDFVENASEIKDVKLHCSIDFLYTSTKPAVAENGTFAALRPSHNAWMAVRTLDRPTHHCLCRYETS